MGRSPCIDDTRPGLKKGPWTTEEDDKLISYINEHGSGRWRALPKVAGLNRCGKSCRLRWTNYLRTDIRRGRFTVEEEDMIIKLHSLLGNKWSRIAAQLPERTDNEIKNHWNTQLKKKLLQMGIDPVTHKPRTDLNLLSNLSHLLTTTQNLGALMNNPLDINNSLRLQPNIAELAKLQVLQNMFQILNNSNSSSPPMPLSLPNMDQTMALNLGFESNISNIVMGSSSSQGLFTEHPNYTDPNQLIIVDNNNNNNNNNCSNNSDTSLDEDDCGTKQSLSNNTSHETLDANDRLFSHDQNESNTSSTTEGSSALNPFAGDLLMEGWEKLLDDADSDFWKEFINII